MVLVCLYLQTRYLFCKGYRKATSNSVDLAYQISDHIQHRNVTGLNSPLGDLYHVCVCSNPKSSCSGRAQIRAKGHRS